MDAAKEWISVKRVQVLSWGWSLTRHNICESRPRDRVSKMKAINIDPDSAKEGMEQVFWPILEPLEPNCAISSLLIFLIPVIFYAMTSPSYLLRLCFVQQAMRSYTLFISAMVAIGSFTQHAYCTRWALLLDYGLIVVAAIFYVGTSLFAWSGHVWAVHPVKSVLMAALMAGLALAERWGRKKTASGSGLAHVLWHLGVGLWFGIFIIT